eukprot:8421034-Alexandrium_andersonii.AAC.1
MHRATEPPSHRATEPPNHRATEPPSHQPTTHTACSCCARWPEVPMAVAAGPVAQLPDARERPSCA